ncbi:hypothetical protein EJB05_09499, partial [Eragrostis curvula]
MMRSGMSATGFIVMLLAVSAGVCSDEYGALLGLVGVLVGANLVAVGVRRMAEKEEPTTTPIGHAKFDGVGALIRSFFLRRNLAVAGLLLASSAVTAVAGEASPVLCFCIFALFLLGISVMAVGVRGE